MTGRDRRAERTGSRRLPRGAPPTGEPAAAGHRCWMWGIANGRRPAPPLAEPQGEGPLPGPVAGAACRWQEGRASRTGRSVAAAGPCLMLWGTAGGRGPGRGRNPGLGRARDRARRCAGRRPAGHPAAPAGPRPERAGEEPRRRTPTVPRIPPRWPRTQRCQLPPPPSREALA